MSKTKKQKKQGVRYFTDFHTIAFLATVSYQIKKTDP